ncbi:hypothetical protein RYX36_003032 [Vicia faba]
MYCWIGENEPTFSSIANNLETCTIPKVVQDAGLALASLMKRKDTSIGKVYDARALGIVIGDKNGTLHGPAVQCCYNLLDVTGKRRLWTQIDGEFDDYILNPKPSGYRRMHEYAEHGLAAHWLYKENGNPFSSVTNASSYFSKGMEEENSSDVLLSEYKSPKARHPVLRVEGSHLRAAVIIGYTTLPFLMDDML